jgi:hypothetical protein
MLERRAGLPVNAPDERKQAVPTIMQSHDDPFDCIAEQNCPPLNLGKKIPRTEM